MQELCICRSNIWMLTLYLTSKCPTSNMVLCTIHQGKRSNSAVCCPYVYANYDWTNFLPNDYFPICHIGFENIHMKRISVDKQCLFLYQLDHSLWYKHHPFLKRLAIKRIENSLRKVFSWWEKQKFKWLHPSPLLLKLVRCQIRPQQRIQKQSLKFYVLCLLSFGDSHS